MVTPTFAKVDDGQLVFRLPKEDQFPPASDVPSELAFRPSSDDEKEAKALKRPVAISVWDAKLTTEGEARSRRGASALKRCDLPVGEVHKHEGLKVVRWEIEGPGGMGHCGIEGLHTDVKADKPRVKHLRRVLCDIAAAARR